MPNYLRNYHGEYFFFTVVTHKRRPIFDKPRWRDLLSEALRKTQQANPWEMTAIVLLPNHLHMIWQMAETDKDYSARIASLKSRFTRAFLAAGGKEGKVTAAQKRKRYRGVWQRKFMEHTIRDAKDFRMHMDYIHANPVKHGLAKTPADWPHSSFHRHVELGHYEPDWCGRVDLPGNVEYVWNE